MHPDDDEIWTRKRGMYFDRDGNEISLREWVALGERDRVEAVHVEFDTVDGVDVSTVWMGINHRYGPGPPLIFETMVFGGPLNQDCRRYTTIEQARAGHAEVLAAVREAAVL